jgi:hypothetical protein
VDVAVVAVEVGDSEPLVDEVDVGDPVDEDPVVTEVGESGDSTRLKPTGTSIRVVADPVESPAASCSFCPGRPSDWGAGDAARCRYSPMGIWTTLTDDRLALSAASGEGQSETIAAMAEARAPRPTMVLVIVFHHRWGL